VLRGLQSVDNVTQVILDAHDLVRCLQLNHRSDDVQRAALQIQDQAFLFCAQHFMELIASPNFLAWSKVSGV
jgi:hypothetical protein